MNSCPIIDSTVVSCSAFNEFNLDSCLILTNLSWTVTYMIITIMKIYSRFYLVIKSGRSLPFFSILFSILLSIFFSKLRLVWFLFFIFSSSTIKIFDSICFSCLFCMKFCTSSCYSW